MGYVVFTTKHHDGFNMFDTRQTDFKITNGLLENDLKRMLLSCVRWVPEARHDDRRLLLKTGLA